MEYRYENIISGVTHFFDDEDKLERFLSLLLVFRKDKHFTYIKTEEDVRDCLENLEVIEDLKTSLTIVLKLKYNKGLLGALVVDKEVYKIDNCIELFSLIRKNEETLIKISKEKNMRYEATGVNSASFEAQEKEALEQEALEEQEYLDFIVEVDNAIESLLEENDFLYVADALMGDCFAMLIESDYFTGDRKLAKLIYTQDSEIETIKNKLNQHIAVFFKNLKKEYEKV